MVKELNKATETVVAMDLVEVSRETTPLAEAMDLVEAQQGTTVLAEARVNATGMRGGFDRA